MRRDVPPANVVKTYAGAPPPSRDPIDQRRTRQRTFDALPPNGAAARTQRKAKRRSGRRYPAVIETSSARIAGTSAEPLISWRSREIAEIFVRSSKTFPAISTSRTGLRSPLPTRNPFLTTPEKSPVTGLVLPE